MAGLGHLLIDQFNSFELQRSQLDFERMQELQKASDSVSYLKKLTQIQRWMFDNYSTDWGGLMDQPVQIYSNGEYGHFGTIAKIKIDSEYPIFTKFLIITTEDQTSWVNLWNLELTKTPDELIKLTKQERLARAEMMRDQFEGLKYHKLIDKAYLSDSRLIIVTKPTYGIDRDTGKELKDMPMGRWLFNIDTAKAANLYSCHIYNLDYAQIVSTPYGPDIHFHFFNCWGGHAAQTLNLFADKNYFAIVDFLITFKCLFPHDGMVSMGLWGKNRRSIVKSDTEVVNTLIRAALKPTKWLVGKESSDPKEILNLCNKTTPLIQDRFVEALGKSIRSYAPVTKLEEVPVGTIIRLVRGSRFFTQAPDQIGVVTDIESEDDDLPISVFPISVSWQHTGDGYQYGKIDLLRLKNQKKLIEIDDGEEVWGEDDNEVWGEDDNE